MSVPASSSKVRRPGVVGAQVLSPVLFTLSILLSAGLLFMAPPLMARGLTSLAGGSTTNWSITFFFFQMMILTGYLYAHILAKLPRIRHQIGIHVIFWLCAVGMMPLSPVLQGRPMFPLHGVMEVDILLHLVSSAGVPLIFLGANVPLIQIWYGRTRGPSSHDPYFLFGASNVGALITLIAYPVIAEPIMGIERLSLVWSGLFACLGGLLFISAFSTTREHPDAKTVSRIESHSSDIRTVWMWGSIAFVLSSLMLATTAKIGVEFGSTPAVWIFPLVLYLTTNLAGFQSKPMFSDKAMIYVYPLAVFAIALVSITKPFDSSGLWPAVVLLLSFTMICLHLNRRLYSLRPDTSRLTVFYLTIALGAVFGGAFNAFFAPMIMKGLYELHLVVLAAASLPVLKNKADSSHIPKWISLGVIVIIVTISTIDTSKVYSFLNPANLSIMIGLGAFMMIRHQIRILGTALICLATVFSMMFDDLNRDTIYESRNFFGIHRISQTGDLRTYVNGSVIVGGQIQGKSPISPEPLFQYHRSTSLGRMAGSESWEKSERIGIVGLGVGSMLAYRSPWQQVKVYEIDPEVVNIALDPEKFTFVKSYGSGASIISGDPLASLRAEGKNLFDVLLIDAKVSGQIPWNLLTLESFREYLDHLDSRGFIAINATSAYHDLKYPISAAADYLGLETYILETGKGLPESTVTGPPTTTIVVSRPAHRPSVTFDGWKRVEALPGYVLMDDSMDILQSMRPLSKPF